MKNYNNKILNNLSYRHKKILIKNILSIIKILINIFYTYYTKKSNNKKISSLKSVLNIICKYYKFIIGNIIIIPTQIYITIKIYEKFIEYEYYLIMIFKLSCTVIKFIIKLTKILIKISIKFSKFYFKENKTYADYLELISIKDLL